MKTRGGWKWGRTGIVRNTKAEAKNDGKIAKSIKTLKELHK